MFKHKIFLLIPIVIVLVGAVVSGWVWYQKNHMALPIGIVSANGRIEAEQVSVAAKMTGRLVEVLGEEGQMVKAGDIIARLDDNELKAQIREAEALLSQREAARNLAKSEYHRAASLQKQNSIAVEMVDQRKGQYDQSVAVYDGAKAALDRLNALLDDTVLKAPCAGRIEHKLLHTGEIIAAGAPVVTLLNVTDVYMVVFLPADDVGTIAVGAPARLVLDPIPQYTIPAAVSYVAADAQFTPKTVETKDERAKLMFRVKLSIPEDLLRAHAAQVKTGVRGLAYVQTLSNAVWPASMDIKLPQ